MLLHLLPVCMMTINKNLKELIEQDVTYKIIINYAIICLYKSYYQVKINILKLKVNFNFE